MRYQKTVDMTTETILALENGTITLQCGQWVRFGSTLSRYVGRTASGSLWIVHSTRPDKTIFNMGKFQRMNKRFKKMKISVDNCNNTHYNIYISNEGYTTQ